MTNERSERINIILNHIILIASGIGVGLVIAYIAGLP